MKKLTHSESEIVKSVNELEAGVSADEICRRLNVSRATLYQWKRKYGGHEVNQLKKLKELKKKTPNSRRCTPISPWTTRFSARLSKKTLETNVVLAMLA